MPSIRPGGDSPARGKRQPDGRGALFRAAETPRGPHRRRPGGTRRARRQAARRVHPGLARLAHGDRAGGGDGAGAGDRLRPGRAPRHPAGLPGGVRPPGLRRRRQDHAPHRRRGAAASAAKPPSWAARTRRGTRMATEEGGSGFNIHPMEQFEVRPALRRRRGALVHAHQRHPLDGPHRPRRQRLDDRRLPRPGAGPLADAVDRRVDLRLRAQDDRGHHRQGRRQVLPLHHHALPLHPLRQPARAHPDRVRPDLAHRRHRGPRARRLHHRHGDRLLQARRALPEALLGRERAHGGAAHRSRRSSRSSPTSCARSATPSDLPAT